MLYVQIRLQINAGYVSKKVHHLFEILCFMIIFLGKSGASYSNDLYQDNEASSHRSLQDKDGSGRQKPKGVPS